MFIDSIDKKRTLLVLSVLCCASLAHAAEPTEFEALLQQHITHDGPDDCISSLETLVWEHGINGAVAEWAFTKKLAVTLHDPTELVTLAEIAANVFVVPQKVERYVDLMRVQYEAIDFVVHVAGHPRVSDKDVALLLRELTRNKEATTYVTSAQLKSLTATAARRTEEPSGGLITSHVLTIILRKSFDLVTYGEEALKLMSRFTERSELDPRGRKSVRAEKSPRGPRRGH